MKNLSSRKIVAVLLLLAIVFGFLLTPLGLEPRNPDLRSYAVVPFFILASLGIPIAAFILLFKKPRISSVLVIINAIIMIFLVAGDQAGFFFTSEPPLGITIFEFLSIAVSIGFLLYGPKLYRASKRV